MDSQNPANVDKSVVDQDYNPEVTGTSNSTKLKEM